MYLARHGRTALNADDRLRGRSDSPLDRVGIAEATKLAQALATKHPTVVISSPLQRTVATARAIGEAAGAAVVIDAGLNDRDYGPWNGKPRTEVVHRYGSVDAAPGVEPLAAVAARARTALDHLVGQYGCGPLVLVSHDAFNRALLEQLDPSLTDIGQRTACFNELSRIDGAWRVDGYDLKPDQPRPTQARHVPNSCRTPAITIVSGSFAVILAFLSLELLTAATGFGLHLFRGDRGGPRRRQNTRAPKPLG